MYQYRHIVVLMGIFLFCGCRYNERPITRNKARATTQLQTREIQYNGFTIRLNRIVNCRYPKHDLIYPEKKYRKLLLMDMSVTYDRSLSETDRELIIPMGAILWDSRGNEYTATPRVIAMAQNNHYIKGDDIDSYNAIWNASLKPGESRRAFVLGFELPEEAIPSKLCWNKRWEQQELFFYIE